MLVSAQEPVVTCPCLFVAVKQTTNKKSAGGDSHDTSKAHSSGKTMKPSRSTDLSGSRVQDGALFRAYSCVVLHSTGSSLTYSCWKSAACAALQAPKAQVPGKTRTLRHPGLKLGPAHDLQHFLPSDTNVIRKPLQASLYPEFPAALQIKPVHMRMMRSHSPPTVLSLLVIPHSILHLPQQFSLLHKVQSYPLFIILSRIITVQALLHAPHCLNTPLFPSLQLRTKLSTQPHMHHPTL